MSVMNDLRRRAVWQNSIVEDLDPEGLIRLQQSEL
jgi:hypothetical protein